MKKILILSLLSLVLLLVYLFLLKSKSTSQGIEIEDRAFVVEDMNDIDYLTIKNPGYPLMHLQRQDGYWVLNQKYKADPNIVSNMIGVLSKMEIKYIPPRTMLEKILGDLDQVGIEIKTYTKNGEVLSDFIMGSNDNQESATFCVKRGANQAYAMHVSVTEGGLRNYFNMPQREIRDKTFIDITPNDISQLRLDYLKNKSSSFSILKNENKYSVAPLEKFVNRGVANPKTINSYLLEFDGIYAESIRTGEIKSDSIRTRIPFARLDIKLENDKEMFYEFYPMIDLMVDSINTSSVLDLKRVERFFVFDHSEDVFIVQNRKLNNLFKTYDYFLN